MMKMKLRLILLLGFLLGLSNSLQAQTNLFSDKASLSLAQALALAEKKHPGLLALHAEIEASQKHAKELPAETNPELILKTEGTTGKAHQGDYLVGVSQNIPINGSLGKTRKVRESESILAQKQYDLQLFNSLQEIRNAYCVTLYQQEAVALLKQIQEEASEFHKIMQARYELGDITLADTSSSTLRLSQAKREEARGQHLLAQAQLQLKTTLGVDAKSEPLPPLADSLTHLFSVFQEEIATPSQSAPSHPALALAQAEVGSREAELALAKAERIPNISAEALYRRNTEDNRDSFDLGLAIPIPLFKMGKMSVKSAKDQVEAARYRVQETELQLKAQHLLAYNNWLQAQANYWRWQKEILPQGQEILRVARERLASGDISQMELIQTQQAQSEWKLSALESLQELVLAASQYRSSYGK